jgi:hypothetical protein
MRINHANVRSRVPRLVGVSVILLGTLVLISLGSSGGAGAAPGMPTSH